MATYHGITKAICLVCDKVTTDTSTLETLNDLDPQCPECEFNLVAWFNEDGRITVTGEIEGNEIRAQLKEENKC